MRGESRCAPRQGGLDLVVATGHARSIRVESPVTTFDPKALLDLNPQDPVLHTFVTD